MNANAKAKTEQLDLHVNGDLTSTNTTSLRARLDELFHDPNRALPFTTVKLDLTSAKMIDSVGLNLIASLLKNLQRQGIKLQIAYSDPNVLRILTFTRLDKHIEAVKA